MLRLASVLLLLCACHGPHGVASGSSSSGTSLDLKLKWARPRWDACEAPSVQVAARAAAMHAASLGHVEAGHEPSGQEGVVDAGGCPPAAAAVPGHDARPHRPARL